MKRHAMLPVLVILLAGSLIPGTALAQETDLPPARTSENTRIYGVAFSVNQPYNELYQAQATGYGIHGIMDYPFVPLLDITADIGWNHFPGNDGGEGLDVWEFAGGLRFVVGAFFMSGEVGYYTGVDNTSFLPGMGLRFDRMEFGVRVKAVSGGSWTGFRFGYYF